MIRPFITLAIGATPAGCHRAILTVAAALAFSGVTPAVTFAQAATRTVTDAPSTNRETRVQRDSLAVHFLRHPKGKPASLSVAGASPSAARAAKGGADTPPAVRVATPLPTRKPKQ